MAAGGESTKRKRMGRKKTEMRKIENDTARQVCFSKRKAGLFKKASELSILCGAEVGVVIFSPGGRPFSYSHRSLASLLERVRNNGNNSSHQKDEASNSSSSSSAAQLVEAADPAPGASSSTSSGRLAELINEVEAEKKKAQELDEALKCGQVAQRYLWDKDTDKMGLEELIEYQNYLEMLETDLAAAAAAAAFKQNQLLGGMQKFGGYLPPL